MKKQVVVMGFLVLLLLSCNISIYPVLPLSGTLEPTALQSSIGVGISDTTGHSANQLSVKRLALVNGYLPTNPFAAQKADIAVVINGSGLLETSKKAELIGSASLALDKLETDFNTALDTIPRRMLISPTADQLGDLANANFAFVTKIGIPFAVAPTNGIIAVYNLKSTEFNITAFGFARGDGNPNAILSSIGGCQFLGALNKPIATHTCGVTGLLAVNNVGAISLTVNLSIEMAFTRDRL